MILSEQKLIEYLNNKEISYKLPEDKVFQSIGHKETFKFQFKYEDFNWYILTEQLEHKPFSNSVTFDIEDYKFHCKLKFNKRIEFPYNKATQQNLFHYKFTIDEMHIVSFMDNTKYTTQDKFNETNIIIEIPELSFWFDKGLAEYFLGIHKDDKDNFVYGNVPKSLELNNLYKESLDIDRLPIEDKDNSVYEKRAKLINANKLYEKLLITDGIQIYDSIYLIQCIDRKTEEITCYAHIEQEFSNISEIKTEINNLTAFLCLLTAEYINKPKYIICDSDHLLYLDFPIHLDRPYRLGTNICSRTANILFQDYKEHKTDFINGNDTKWSDYYQKWVNYYKEYKQLWDEFYFTIAANSISSAQICLCNIWRWLECQKHVFTSDFEKWLKNELFYTYDFLKLICVKTYNDFEINSEDELETDSENDTESDSEEDMWDLLQCIQMINNKQYEVKDNIHNALDVESDYKLFSKNTKARLKQNGDMLVRLYKTARNWFTHGSEDYKILYSYISSSKIDIFTLETCKNKNNDLKKKMGEYYALKKQLEEKKQRIEQGRFISDDISKFITKRVLDKKTKTFVRETIEQFRDVSLKAPPEKRFIEKEQEIKNSLCGIIPENTENLHLIILQQLVNESDSDISTLNPSYLNYDMIESLVFLYQITGKKDISEAFIYFSESFNKVLFQATIQGIRVLIDFPRYDAIHPDGDINESDLWD